MHPFNHLFFIHPSPTHLFNHPSIHSSIHPSTHLSLHSSILASTHPSIHQSMKWNFLVSLETQLCHVIFFWKPLWEDFFLFAEADMWKNVLLRIDMWCFSRSSLETHTIVCVVLLEWTLEKTHDVWEGYKQTVDDTVWYWFSLPLPRTRADWQSLDVFSGLACCCWFMSGVCDRAVTADSCEPNCWYPDNADCTHSNALFLNRPTSSFALLTFPFYYLWGVVG